MSLNRSLLTQITKDLNKKPSKPKVPKNQWQHPGEITTVNSPNITMDAVDYPVLGVPNVGAPQMMYPDQQYYYPEAGSVTEYPMMGNGGYVVTRSNDHKGKTHKVTGPDGTVKYFGDSKLGQHPKDPERKKAFYARHKKNLENNPFFRAFARKTWAEGGQTSDERDMVNGIADILSQVNNADNRAAIAQNMINDFKDQNVTYDLASFMQKANLKEGGEMIRRADGSYSRRGLWDNIRANKGSGKKPSKQMLEQERKIKAQMQYGGALNKYQTAGQVIKPNNGYIDLQKYGIDPITEDGLAKARELNAMYPGSKFVCTANGCADIAQRIAKAEGVDFPRRNAWEYRGNIPEVYTAPGYKAELEAGKPLHDPRSYAFPEEVKNMSGVLVGLNRKDNYDGHMAKTRKEANDSRDYINRMLYPGSNAMHEHIGFYKDGIMYHGTAGNKSHPAYFVLDNPDDGISLPGVAKYNVVNAMEEPGLLDNIANGFTSLKTGISNLMSDKKQKGGSIYDFMTSHGMNGSFANRKKLFNQYFGKGYTGTADQNMQMLQLMQQGKFKAPAQPMMATPYAPKPAFSGATTGLSFLQQTRAPYKPGKAPQYKAQPKQNPAFEDVESSIPDMLRKGADAIGLPLPVTQAAMWLGSKLTGSNIGMSNNSLSPEQQEILYQTIKNARQRTAATSKGKKDYNPNVGGTSYEDFGDQGYGSKEDYIKWIDSGKMNMFTDPKFKENLTGNPAFQLATTVGRGSYQVDPNDPNIIHYTDSYDFVQHDKTREIYNGKSDNAYQPFRRGLSKIESDDAEKDPANRIHFAFNVKEMEDRLAKKKGAVGMRYGGLTRFQVAGQSNAPKVTAKVNPFMPIVNPNEANQEYQLPDNQTFFTGVQPMSHEAGIAANVKRAVAEQNPELKNVPVPGSGVANATKVANSVANFGDGMLSMFNTYSQLANLNNQQKQREANSQMLRSQNATWNQQYNPQLNRGDYSQGPSSYGLFKPNQMFAQQGIEVPLSMDEAAKYTVDSIDSLVGANTIGIGAPEIQQPQFVQQQMQEAPVQEATATPMNEPVESTESLKDSIAYKESRGNYKAFNPKGGGSGAVGKYQFRWDHNKDWIGTVTGIKNKQSFLNNPEAQEKAFDYWDQNVLTPNAQKIKSQYKPNLNINEIKMLIHFQGPTGADRYFKTGKYTTDAEGTTPMRYLGKNIDTKQGVKATNLDSNLMAFVSNMGNRFPGLTMSSGNDSQHMKGSKHYKNKAIDIGANSSNRQSYNQLANFLAKNPTIKSQYGIEDIINEGDHLHVEMMQRGGEYELTADQIMQIKAMGGDVEFI